MQALSRETNMSEIETKITEWENNASSGSLALGDKIHFPSIWT
jgi:hypothetical protein